MNRLFSPIDAILTGRFDTTGFKGIIRLIVVLLVLSFLFNSSDLVVRPVDTWMNEQPFFLSPFFAQKVEHPFTQLDTRTDESHHFDKVAFRFVPFVIAKVCFVGQRGLYFLQVSWGVIFPLLIWRLLLDATKSRELANVGAILISTVYCGFSFFFDTNFFDGFAYCFLAASMLLRDRRLIMPLLLCAGFTDERAVLASSLVVLWHAYNSEKLTFGAIGRWLAFLVGYLALYALLRILIGDATGLKTGDDGFGLPMVGLNMTNIVLLLWSVFEGGWILIFLAAFALIDQKTHPHLVVLWGCVFALAAILFGGLMIADVIRSQQYAFPLLPLAISIINKSGTAFPPRLRRVVILLTLLTPITIYLGMTVNEWGVSYNMWPLKPGYVEVYQWISGVLREALSAQ